LNNLEQIKDGINFRGYAQRDPLTEYKKESFMAFERMMLEIKMNIVSALYKMNATQASEEAFERLEETRREELAQLSMSGPTEDGEKPEVVDVGGNRKARRSKAKKGL
jgi:preprotein translocase subunit SecA